MSSEIEMDFGFVHYHATLAKEYLLSFVISKPIRKHIDTTELKRFCHLHRYGMNVIYDLLYISAFLSCPKGSEIQERFVPTWQQKHGYQML